MVDVKPPIPPQGLPSIEFQDLPFFSVSIFGFMLNFHSGLMLIFHRESHMEHFKERLLRSLLRLLGQSSGLSLYNLNFLFPWSQIHQITLLALTAVFEDLAR